jgi:inner membrane protein
MRRAHQVFAVLAPPLAVSAVPVLDLALTSRPWPVPVKGLLDEPAHLLTAWLVLAAAGTRGRLWPWALAGAVVIDLDHIPLYLWGALDSGAGRPVTHSMATVVVLLAVAAVPPARGVATGLALGVTLHFLRDVVTGPGLPLWWPLHRDRVLLPYWPYLLLLAALGSVAVVRRMRSARSVASA